MRITSNNTARLYVLRQKIIEFIRFDSNICSFFLSLFYLGEFFFAKITHNWPCALLAAGRLFRRTQFSYFRNLSTKILKSRISHIGFSGVGDIFLKVCQQTSNIKELKRISYDIQTGNTHMFDRRMLVLSPPQDCSKGVILIKFTEYFKYVAQIFNFDLLCQKYIIVFEPSFSGYFDKDILFLLNYKNPFIIQAPEPVDYEFIQTLNSNLYPVNIGANWWVDYNIFYPIPNMRKDFDLIVVSIWADFKRHFHLFEAMAIAKTKLRIALVGKPWPRQIDEIKMLARLYGVESQISFFENISQNELNLLYNRSKSFLLLSKKEGINKAIIEALFANLPIFLLEGFNYGYHYPYINSLTGSFIKRTDLPTFLIKLSQIIDKKKLAPHQWVKSNMTHEIATNRLCQVLQQIEIEREISINKKLAYKVNNPELDYFDSRVRQQLQPAYSSLKNYLAHRPAFDNCSTQ